MRVLLTGGAGYIGSHTALALLNEGHDVAVIDDLSNGNVKALQRVEDLTGKTISFHQADFTDALGTRAALAGTDFDAVVHFAGLKAVAESVEQPIRYYQTNLGTTLTLLDLLEERGITKLIFSSSATVYGVPQTSLITETHQAGVGLTNPYGWSKYMNEQILKDAATARPEMEVVLLRYFNPVGAHSSGCIGEDPAGIPNNLLPFVAQVAVGRREQLSVFGDDYDTPDGTGVRDYIHVMDLAEGHVAAMQHARQGVQTFNLGSGVGTSVLEAVHAFEEVSCRPIPYQIAPRRTGDLATVVADPQLAKKVLNWQTTRTFKDACRDAWNWQTQNPTGY